MSGWAYAHDPNAGRSPRYLGLAFWPHPLVFDYGNAVASPSLRLVPGALLIAGLLAGTAVALRRWPAAGFAGCWFFAHPGAEFQLRAGRHGDDGRAAHVPAAFLAAVVAVVVLGAYRWVGQPSLVFLMAMAVVFGILTARRNYDYESGRSIWADTVAKCPENARARGHLAYYLFEAGHSPPRG